MTTTRRKLSGRLRTLLLASSAGVAVLSCVDGNSLGTEAPVQLQVVPTFAVLPSPFNAGPIDRIRITALEPTSEVVVTSTEVDVDPAAEEWVVVLAIDLNGSASIEVRVQVELLSGGSVEWSGELGVFTVGAGLTTSIQQVTEGAPGQPRRHVGRHSGSSGAVARRFGRFCNG